MLGSLVPAMARIHTRKNVNTTAATTGLAIVMAAAAAAMSFRDHMCGRVSIEHSKTRTRKKGGKRKRKKKTVQ